ncbi:MAG: glycosyltransferase [Deltaproteobacteria bacterium]
MKILHLATQDIGGGAADAAYRLHCNMRLYGIDSRMLVLRKNSNDPNVIDVSAHLTISDKLRQFLRKIKNKYLRRTFRLSLYFYVDCQKIIAMRLLIAILPFWPDAIIAHWISNFINVCTLRDLNHITHAPILWYLMDMAPLTGGCHYAFGCTGYTRQCGNCPQIGVGKRTQDLSHRQWKNKWSCLQETNITAVTASTWSQNQLESSSLFLNKRHENILLGIDGDIFCPTSQKKARKQLDLPNDRKIIFFGAQSLHEERKGVRHIVESLRLLYAMLDANGSLSEDQILVVTAGRNGNTAKLDIAFEHRHIGFLSGNVMLAAGYQAADVFVNASIEDSGPMMINESLLCGTPVVSFEMGVATDLVHAGMTGYRARLRDEHNMAAGLLRILELNNEECRAMRERCRNYGLQRCHPDVQVRAFAKLCSELIADGKNQCRREC